MRIVCTWLTSTGQFETVKQPQTTSRRPGSVNKEEIHVTITRTAFGSILRLTVYCSDAGAQITLSV